MKDERRDKIREYIDAKGETTLKNLSEIFPDCSTMTLRRDLIFLEEEGFIRRTRGGAIALRIVAGSEGMYSQRATENIAGKVAIAKACVLMLGFETSLFLDSGSTVMCLARQLADSYRPIITSGVNIAQELIKHPSFDVTILGGQVNVNTLSVSGQMSEENLDMFNIETAVMGTSGFTIESGFSSGTHTENELKEKIIKKARKVIMLMDEKKIGRNMPLTFATLADVDVIISDYDADDDFLKACSIAGVEYTHVEL